MGRLGDRSRGGARAAGRQPSRRIGGPKHVRAAALVIWLGVSRAHADDATELHEGLTREPTGPLLQIESMLRSNPEGFDALVKHESVDFELGPRTRARALANAWTNPLFNGEGWGTTLRLVHDFKVIQFSVEAGYQRVDSTFAHGGYAFVGLSLTRTLRLSKWMTAWISLSVGKRRWLGQQPPPGEADDTAVMLNLGTTFR